MNKNFVKWTFASSCMVAASAASAADMFFSADRFAEMSALPGTSLAAPTGMVASQGSAFVGIGGIHNDDSDTTDGSLTVGMGFGNAMDSIGATASVTVGSINNDIGFGERAALNLSVGKFFTDDQIGIAFGAVNLASKNNLTKKPDPSFFAAVTKVFSLPNHPIIVNIGVGSNDFVDVNYESDDRTKNMTPFASVGYYVSPHISVIADYTAHVGSLGLSVSPVNTMPLIFTVGAYDVGGDSVSVIAALGYSFSY